jgi:hypothetical protein
MDRRLLSPQQINELVGRLTPLPTTPVERIGETPATRPVQQLPTITTTPISPRREPPVVIPTMDTLRPLPQTMTLPRPNLPGQQVTLAPLPVVGVVGTRPVQTVPGPTQVTLTPLTPITLAPLPEVRLLGVEQRIQQGRGNVPTVQPFIPSPVQGTQIPLPTLTAIPARQGHQMPLPTITTITTRPAQLPLPTVSDIIGLPPLPATGAVQPKTAVPSPIFEPFEPLDRIGDPFLDLLRDTFNVDDISEDEVVLFMRPLWDTGIGDISPLDYKAVTVTGAVSAINKAMLLSEKELAEAISSVYGHIKNATKDDLISLYWWGMIFEPRLTRTNEEREEIAKLTLKELQSVVPPNWNYPRDRASIIFKLNTGYNPPRADATKEPRYNQIIATDPNIVMKLAQFVYNYFGEPAPANDGNVYELYSHFSPYRHVALQIPSIMEAFVINYDRNNVDNLAARMGMIIPTRIDSVEEKEKYYFDNLSAYKAVMTRDPRLIPVPDLADIPEARVPQLLARYTDQELLDGYELTDRFRNIFQYASRKHLIDRIVRTRARTNNEWHFRKNNCLNADRDNIFELEKRKDSDNDPIISYGTMTNYRCWNKDELEGTWEEHNGTFSFNVPDWRQGDPYKSFPIASIRQLRDLLQGRPEFDGLIRNIDNGFLLMANAEARVREFRNYYNGLPHADKAKVNEYLAWMFLTSMYMRFWLGPGRPYPSVWREYGGGGERCETAERNENVQRQFVARGEILEKMPENVRERVLSFPRIEYNFRENRAAVGAEPINFIIEKAQIGKFCLAEASDHLLQTSYYLTLQILNTNLDGFNTNVNTFIGKNVWQPLFNPLDVTGTRHIDPEYQLQRLK